MYTSCKVIRNHQSNKFKFVDICSLVQSICNFDWLQYCLKATLQTHIKLCSSRAPTCTLIEPLNALNLSFYSYIESISMLGYDKNPFGDKSTYLLVISCSATLFLGAETHVLNIFDRLDTHLLFTIKLHAFATLL